MEITSRENVVRENLLTRKEIGNIIAPNRKDPSQLIAFLHISNRELFDGEFRKVNGKIFYNESVVDIFKLILEEMNYKNRGVINE